MKAKKILEAMVHDSKLAENSLILNYYSFDGTVSPNQWLREATRAQIYTGTVTPGDYLAVWECDGNKVFPFQLNNPPDVVLERIDSEEHLKDDRFIWLWKIEY